jgi:hypothetical protein
MEDAEKAEKLAAAKKKVREINMVSLITNSFANPLVIV